MKFKDVVDGQCFIEDNVVYVKVPYQYKQMTDMVALQWNARVWRSDKTYMFKDDVDVELFVYPHMDEVLTLLKQVGKCREIHTLIDKCDKCLHYDRVQEMIERIEDGR